MKKKRKFSINRLLLCGIFLITLFVTLVIFATTNPQFAFFINHGIYLPKPLERNSIFYFDFKEGQDLEIWNYKEENFNKITSKTKFKEIYRDGNLKIKRKLTEYYELLDNDERKLFDQNVKFSEVLDSKNYYYLKEKKNESKTFLIIIASLDDKKIYIFNSVT